MPTPPLTLEDVLPALRGIAKLAAEEGYSLEFHGKPSAINEYARRTGQKPSTLYSRLETAAKRWGVTPEKIEVPRAPTEEELETIPDGAAVLARHAPANTEYIQRARASKMRVVPVREEPFAVAFVGDPHVDNKGCDLAALKRDMEIIAASGMRAVMMGDLLDNFQHRPRLAPKQAHNRMSVSEGFGIGRWLIHDSGVKWDALLLGNHDAWGGDPYAEMVQGWARDAKTRFYNWWVRLRYQWSGRAFTVDAAHDFRGSFIYNPVHGNMRRALEDGTADLYVSAHRHHAAFADAPNDFRGRHYWHARTAGYKAWDEYADQKMYGQSDEGQSAVAVIDPNAETRRGRCQMCDSVAEGAEYLQYLRGRA